MEIDSAFGVVSPLVDRVIQDLDSDLQYIKGVGPNRVKALRGLGYTKIKHVLLHLPYKYLDRRKITAVSQLVNGQLCSQIVTVEQIIKKHRSKKFYKIICSDATGTISLIYFHGTQQFISRFSVGAKIVISGKVEFQYGEWQMHHPEIVDDHAKASLFLIIEPVYHASAKLSSKSIARIIKEVIKSLPKIPEWLPLDLLDHLHLPSWHEAIRILHQPQDDNDLARQERALARLAIDEVIAEQCALKMMRDKMRHKQKISFAFSGALQRSIIATLPFQLTSQQNNALKEISCDQLSSNHMMRVLQGDVGSGKTIVALLSMLNAIEAGYQSIIIAPTELLAKQHFESFSKVLQSCSDISLTLLIRNTKCYVKRIIYENIANGTVQLIIGTHALIQPQIKFYKPGLIVMDEQHRFGVKQRMELLEKGLFCDVLMMSATPIPRTLSMMYSSDIDVSTIKERPLGRLPIITCVISSSKIDAFINSLVSKVVDGEKIYWICPLIEESETLALKTVNERYAALQTKFGNKVAVLHSKIKNSDKDAIMRDFAATDGTIKVVVATTVIEVGVDVSDATVMVIEHAEFFGLAQMHQLRGRVGRGVKQSYCILIYGNMVSTAAKRRLEAMKNCDDGFVLAEQDLSIRGGGRVTGLKQSGEPEFLVFDIMRHQKFLAQAKKLVADNHFMKQAAVKVLMDIYGHSYSSNTL